jgi:hypothetical protein
MKRLACLLMVVVLLLSASFVSAAEALPSIEAIATDLVNDAIANPNEFGLPNLEGDYVYICNPVNPYIFEGGSIERNENVEYYFVITDEAFLACIKLCYVDGNPVSASLNTSIAEILNANCQIDDAFRLITSCGDVFLKTLDNIIKCNSSSHFAESPDIASIEHAVESLEILTIRSRLTGIVTNPITSRSSVTLSVPYVPQIDNTCWAAAGAAFGKYYNPNSRYASYSATYLSYLMGVDPINGAGMDTTLTMLRDYFDVDTVHYRYSLSRNESISLFQQGKPILAGFAGPGISMGHMVVLCGFNSYSSSGNTVIYIRDSNCERMQSVIWIYGETLILDYDYGECLEWVETAYYNYTP